DRRACASCASSGRELSFSIDPSPSIDRGSVQVCSPGHFSVSSGFQVQVLGSNGCVCAFFLNRLAVVAQPVGRKFQAAMYPIGSKHKVDATAEFVGDEVTNGAGPIAGLAGSDDRGASDLLPFEHQRRPWLPVYPLIPLD